MKLIQDPIFEELLVAHPDSHWVGLHAAFLEPLGDKWNVIGSPSDTSSFMEGLRSPEQGDSIGCRLVLKGNIEE